MKTKLELYLAVQAAAEKSLDSTQAAAEKSLAELLKPLNLVPVDLAFASQLFFSRRQRMLDLRQQPITTAGEKK